MNRGVFILERTVPPEEEPVSIGEIKRQLRSFASDTSEDDDMNALIASAREWVEDYTGRALMPQTWRLTLDNSVGHDIVGGDTVSGYRPGYYTGALWWQPTFELMLRRAPVISVDSFVSVDAAGVETAIAASQYSLREKDSKWPRIVPLNGANWSIGTYRVTFTAGFADADSVPVRFKQAIRLHAEGHYDRDPQMLPLLLEVAEKLIKPERADLQIT